MSGGLFTSQLFRETGIEISAERVERLRHAHASAYRQQTNHIRPLPGAHELLNWLSEAGIRWAIATSGRMEAASVNLAALGVDPDRIPVVTRDQVKYARPDPDLFLAAAERLNAPIETAVVVGDSIWDMLNSLQLSLNIFSIVPGSLRSTLMNSFADERWPLVLRYSPSPSSQAKQWLTLRRRAAVGTREQKH